MLALFALASSAAAYNATTTVESTAYVTIPCSSGDVVNYGTYTYTATEATTLTVDHCGCTASPSVSHVAAPSVAAASSTVAPALANGAAAAKVGAVAAGAAAVAYLL